MGSRGCIGVIESGALSLTYDHWIAQRLPDELLPGPAFALSRAVDGSPTEDWLDTTWSEGDALIDVDRGVLLFYGGEDALYDKGFREALLEMMRVTWAGWQVRWCHEGLLDITDYLGLSREHYLTPIDDFYPPWRFAVLRRDWAADGHGDDIGPVGVVSLRRWGATMHAVVLDDWEDLASGPDEYARGWRATIVPFTDDVEPMMGAFVDFDERELTVWSIRPAPGIRDLLQPIWPGWTVTFTGDDPRLHERLSGLRLDRPCMHSPGRHAEVLHAAYRTLTDGTHPERLVGLLEADGHAVKVTPAFFLTTHPDLAQQSAGTASLAALWERFVPDEPSPDA